MAWWPACRWASAPAGGHCERRAPGGLARGGGGAVDVHPAQVGPEEACGREPCVEGFSGQSRELGPLRARGALVARGYGLGPFPLGGVHVTGGDPPVVLGGVGAVGGQHDRQLRFLVGGVGGGLHGDLFCCAGGACCPANKNNITATLAQVQHPPRAPRPVSLATHGERQGGARSPGVVWWRWAAHRGRRAGGGGAAHRERLCSRWGPGRAASAPPRARGARGEGSGVGGAAHRLPLPAVGPFPGADLYPRLGVDLAAELPAAVGACARGGAVGHARLRLRVRLDGAQPHAAGAGAGDLVEVHVGLLDAPAGGVEVAGGGGDGLLVHGVLLGLGEWGRVPR